MAHVYGKTRPIDDKNRTAKLLEQLTQVHESQMPSPYQLDLADERRAVLVEMIAGFEIEITELQDKFNPSQNRSLAEQQRVIEELNQSKNSITAAVAKLMSE